jgi:putative tryptophan/tyrosine transport system substrate-binding protein
MRRREFISLFGSIVIARPLDVCAAAGKIATVGVLWHAGSAEQEKPYYVGLLEGFKELGYIDGSNIKFEHRFPNEKPELFKSMAAELVGLNVDVLVTVGPQTAHYGKDATANNPIPVVFIFVPDPVGSGLAQSLARPGKNTTGLSNFGADLVGKRLQILKEMIPALSRVAVLVNPNTPDSELYIKVTQDEAKVLELTSQPFEARSPDELEPAFDAMAKASMQAVTINAEGVAYQQRAIIPKMALARHLPLCVWSKETFDPGALMSYGPDQIAMCRRAASFVDKILKGTKPGEIPVEQPTRLELRINRKVADALGLSVPPSLLATADELIE